MNTIRLSSITRNGRHFTERLEWGSTDWAENSCLADWSTLERQWLGTENGKSAQGGSRRGLGRALIALALCAALLAVACTPWLRLILLSALEALMPVLGRLAELAPLIALAFGLLVLAGVALGLWREADGPASGEHDPAQSRS